VKTSPVPSRTQAEAELTGGMDRASEEGLVAAAVALAPAPAGAAAAVAALDSAAVSAEPEVPAVLVVSG